MKVKGGFPLSFTDVLFITLTGLAGILALALLLINPPERKQAVQEPAVALIVVNWDDLSDDDVDIWVLDPGNGILSFRNKLVNMMALDRDDRGKSTDTFNNETVYINREVVSFRKLIPGSYYVNLHMYNKIDKDPINATVELVKLNPYSILYRETIVLTRVGQEEPIMQFIVTTDYAIEMGVVKRLFVNSNIFAAPPVG